MGFVSVKTHTPAATEVYVLWASSARMAAGIVRHTGFDRHLWFGLGLARPGPPAGPARPRPTAPPHRSPQHPPAASRSLPRSRINCSCSSASVVIRRAKARGGLLVFARVVIARLPQARSIMRCAARVTRRRSASGDKGKRLPLLSRCSAPICAISTWRNSASARHGRAKHRRKFFISVRGADCGLWVYGNGSSGSTAD